MNGIPVDKVHDWYVANTGYVLQLAAPYYEELTVRENLTLAAQMRLSTTLSLSEKLDHVEKVMREVLKYNIIMLFLKCWPCCNTFVILLSSDWADSHGKHTSR